MKIFAACRSALRPLLWIGVASLSGCGQYGDLYLPEEKPATQAPTADVPPQPATATQPARKTEQRPQPPVLKEP